MDKKFVEMSDSTYESLLEVAKANGYDSVEKFLTDFAKSFSTGCSVTILKKSARAA